MAAQEEHAALAHANKDDLTVIEGIGPTYSRALYKAGICRFTELARYTPETLSEILTKATGSRVAPSRIEASDWLGQAKNLARQEDTERLPEPGEQQPDHPPKIANSPPWRQHAGFSLFFDYLIDKQDVQVWQTRVYHDESGRQSVLSGHTPSLWVDWILQQAELPPAMDPTQLQSETLAETVETDPLSVPGGLCDVRVEICDVQVSEAPAPYAAHARELVVDVRLSVSAAGMRAEDREYAPFQILVHTVDLQSGRTCLVASEQAQLDRQVLEHTRQLRFPTPDLGRYQLQSTVFPAIPGTRVAVWQGPIINIVLAD